MLFYFIDTAQTIKKLLYLQCVFHGIRLKVNEDWLS